jgi:carbonic anhydrase/acetyltransferase-like protein (isoleucine patch superfamily)
VLIKWESTVFKSYMASVAVITKTKFSAYVGREVELTNGCIVGAACKLSCPEVVPENTVIFGSRCSRRQQADRPPVSCISSW